MLRAIGRQQQHAAVTDLLEQRVGQRGRLRVGPVQVLDDQQHGLALALAQHDARDGGEDPPAALGRLQAVPLGVVGGDVAERQDRRHRPVQRRIEPQQLGGDLGPDAGGVVAALDLEIAGEQRRDRGVRRGLGEGHRRRLQQQPRLRARRAGELPHQTRLADARLPGDADDLAFAGGGALEPPLEAAHLVLAAEEAGQRAGRRLHARGRRRAAQLEDRDRLLEALDRHRAVRLDLDVAIGEAAGGVGDERRPRPGQLLHARRQVCRLAHGAVLDVEVAADRAHDDVAGVEAHADLHVDALPPPQLVGVAADRALHAQRRVAGAHGVVLVGDGRAEQGHDAVAHHLVDRALVAMDRLHHALEHGIEEGARVLGVAIGQELERALEVGEEHGDLLALAGQRRAGRQDLAGEVHGRVSVGGGEARVTAGRRDQRRPAFLAELVAGRVRPAAGGAGRFQPAAARAAELRVRRIVVVAPRALHGVESPASRRYARDASRRPA